MAGTLNDDLLDRYLREEIDAQGTGWWLTAPSGARVLVGSARGAVNARMVGRALRRVLAQVLDDAIREVLRQ